jgi:hypothetical protein
MLDFLSQAMSGSLAATCRLSMGQLTSRANAVYRAIVTPPYNSSSLNERRYTCLTPPSCQIKTAFAARLLEVCLRPEYSAFHPPDAALLILFGQNGLSEGF